jgi:signal peptidase I
MKTFKEQLITFIIFIPILVILRTSFFEPYKIPSGSMIPNLMIGDFLLVNKFSYGLKVPFSDWGDAPIYITPFKEPKRNDIIVFKAPKDPDKEYIKRVLAIPGDTIEIINKIVYLNNIPLNYVLADVSDFIKNAKGLEKANPNFSAFYETLEQKKHIIFIDTNSTSHRNMSKIMIPPGYFFAMGDNRDYSSDSRFWGLVPFENIKGKAMFVWFSLSIPWPWLKEFNLPFSFRLDRIGTMIE